MMNTNRRHKILITGIGSQGVLVAAGMLGTAAFASGLEAKLGQLHGMAQRGGSVEAYVLIGPGKTAFIETGDADVLIAFEPLEALRVRPKLSGRTKIIISTNSIVPFLMTQQRTTYPDISDIATQLAELSSDIYVVDTPAIIEEVGTSRILNTAMLGAYAALEISPVNENDLLDAVLGNSPPRFAKANELAFKLGKQEVVRWESDEQVLTG